MKKILTLLIIFSSTLTTNAQLSSDLGKIALSIVMPDNVEGMNASQLSKLQTKITQIVATTGLAASGYNNNFVIYPKFAIYESSVVESGIQDITIITCELTLFIKQVDNNVIFSTISKPLKGNGKSKNIAITNALSKININESDYKLFIESGKDKIIQYYESKCQDIITKSESLVKMQDYEQALGLLMSVPEEVSCYNKVQEKSIQAFKAYQNHNCSRQIQEAKTSLAANNYNATLETLSQIDPAATCFNESQTLIKIAESKIDAEEKKQWNLRMKVYDDNVALQKQRINAIKDVAVAYYKSRPTTVSYNYIIR